MTIPSSLQKGITSILHKKKQGIREVKNHAQDHIGKCDTRFESKLPCPKAQTVTVLFCCPAQSFLSQPLLPPIALQEASYIRSTENT